MEDIVKFKLTNGNYFGIYRRTLEQYPHSFLARLVEHETQESFHSRDAEGNFLIDEDPIIFSALLTFYRYGVWSIQSGELRQAIIDKYILPQIHSATPIEEKSNSNTPTYVYVTYEHASSAHATTRPMPTKISAFDQCPFPITHNNSFRSTDPIEVANHLADHGYTIEQMDFKTHSFLMKRKN